MVTKEKSFMTLTTGVNLIKPFFFVIDTLDKQARAFAPNKPLQTSLKMISKSGSLLIPYSQISGKDAKACYGETPQLIRRFWSEITISTLEIFFASKVWSLKLEWSPVRVDSNLARKY